jgi:hypothetical protein
MIQHLNQLVWNLLIVLLSSHCCMYACVYLINMYMYRFLSFFLSSSRAIYLLSHSIDIYCLKTKKSNSSFYWNDLTEILVKNRKINFSYLFFFFAFWDDDIHRLSSVSSSKKRKHLERPSHPSNHYIFVCVCAWTVILWAHLLHFFFHLCLIKQKTERDEKRLL